MDSDDTSAARVGGSLLAARKRRGWTREELAYRSGVSYAAIAQIESGRRKDVRLTSLTALADALAVTLDHLVSRSPALARPLLEHRALAYGSDDEFLAGTVAFMADGAEQDERLLAVTKAANNELLRDALGARARHVQFVDAQTWYDTPPATLARYRQFVNESLDNGARWVRIIGEPVWQGRSTAEVAEWTRYEAAINLLLASAAATIVCPYDTRSLPSEIVSDCARTHPVVTSQQGSVPSEEYLDVEAFLLQSELRD